MATDHGSWRSNSLERVFASLAWVNASIFKDPEEGFSSVPNKTKQNKN